MFVIIRENRTYDQMLGDVVGGNGDATLATFGDGTAASDYGLAPVSPNAHAIVQRFPETNPDVEQSQPAAQAAKESSVEQGAKPGKRD